MSVLLAVDAEEKLISFARQVEAAIQTTRTDLTEASCGTVTIAAATTDLAIPFGGVASGKVLYLECDAEITIKLNGGSTAMKLTPSSAQKAKLFWEGLFTGLTVSNASATAAASLTYMIAG